MRRDETRQTVHPGQAWVYQLLVAAMLLVVMLVPVRAFAASGDLVPIVNPPWISDGTYEFDSAGSTTGMIPVDSDDGPVQAIVSGNSVTIVLDVYSPSKYDKMYPGKRSEAPDPAANGLLYGQFVPADDYSGSSEIWTDRQGQVGPAGNRYKAIRFLIPMTKDQFAAMINNGVDDDIYVTLRRASWSPSNPLKWMGSNDHYITLGTARKVSDSTVIPTTGYSLPNSDTEEPAEDPIVRVKALIDALPRNPYVVVEADRAAIEEAQAAYNALSADDQARLDAEKTVTSQSYGRTLESDIWALDSLAPVDDSTTLPNGTYITQVKATCSLGKSDSARMRLFKLVKVVVKDGRAQALIEHDTSVTDTVRIGSREYRHVNTDENAHSQFLIPVNLNSTFHLSQLAKNATENTVGIVYEMTITIDEKNAKPDSSSTATPQSTSTSASNGTRNNAAALAAVAKAKQEGTVGKANDSKKNGKTDKDKSKDDANRKMTAMTATDTTGVGPEGGAGAAGGASPAALPFTVALLAALAVFGSGGFTAVFYRRENRLRTWTQASAR